MRARVRALALTVLVCASVLLALAAPAFAAPEGPTTVLAQEADTDAPAEGAEGAEPTTLFGTFRNADGPVEGVELRVDGPSGEAGTATSDASGQWELEVDQGGDYEVTVETLPEGVALRDPEATTVEVSVEEGGRRAVPIPLGEASITSGRVALAVQQLLSGIRFGLIIAMTAVGLSLIFGTTGLINFAHGEIVVFGAITAWFLNSAGLHLLIAGAIAVVLSGVLGGALDRGIFRPLTRRGVGLFQLLVLTIGLSLVLRFLLLIFFGGQARPYAQYAVQQQVSIGPFAVTPRDLFVMVGSALILVGVATLLRRSRVGKAMRAVADNRDLAESSGIDVERVVGIVWITGSALAGLGGILYGTLFRVDYLFGFQPMLLLMFAGIILGGLGTAYGAMLGSLVVGLVTELSVVWFPNELKLAWALGVLVLVLLFRPQGLLGRRERIG